MSLVYLDTCVWLSALNSKHSKHALALEILDKAKKVIYTVFVTHHILAEILDVLKDQMVISKNVRNSPSKQLLEQLVKDKYKSFIKTLLSLVNVRIINPNASTNRVFRPSFSLLYRYFGQIVFDNKCPICKGKYNFIDVDTIYEKDALHALMAWNLNCNIFITFDDDFKQLTREKSLLPMSIQVL
jgi:predicted nucleic acid-binding protein